MTSDSGLKRRPATDGASKQSESIDREEAEGLSSRVLRFLDEERRLTSRYLHDATAQNLMGISMNLRRALARADQGDSELRGLLAEGILLAEKSISEIRTLSYCLHPPFLDEAGLAAALRWYVKAAGTRGGLTIHLEMPESIARMPRDVETAIFRIAQEAIANARRHSGSPDAFLRLTDMGTSVLLEVEDRGRGMTISADPHSELEDTSPEFGILGMEARVKRLGGTFTLITEVGKGTTIRVALPVETPAAERSAAAGKHKA